MGARQAAKTRATVGRSRAQIGDYELLNLVGRGGMAEAWLARDPSGEEVVLKRLPRGRQHDAHLRACLADEGRIASQLRHPAIVRLLDRFQHDGEPVLVYEYVRGMTLWRLCRRAQGAGTGLPLDLVLRLGIQLAEALDYVHHKQDANGQPLAIIHRDLSPQNIMVDHQGQVRLLDFGVALSNSNERFSVGGGLYGNLGYASPELVTGQSLTGASDQFALGTLLWECLARRRLFGAEAPAKVVAAVARAEVPSLSAFRPDLDAELAEVIGRCLQRDPQARFGRCEALAQRLEAIAERVVRIPVRGAGYSAWLDRLRRAGPVPRRLPNLTPSRPGKRSPLLQLRSLLDRIRLGRRLRTKLDTP
ncbi:MAG: hypothetical protein CMH58_06470 [Myxococcales bacterium]|nr:hypothetical protein [Myxococcales bacterium]